MCVQKNNSRGWIRTNALRGCEILVIAKQGTKIEAMLFPAELHDPYVEEALTNRIKIGSKTFLFVVRGVARVWFLFYLRGLSPNIL